MLEYEADVLELRAGVGGQEVMHIARLPHEKRGGYLKTIVSRRVARVPFRTWVDQLLDAVDDGRAQMLQNGGYPYLFFARGADIKANFAGVASTAISALPEQAWYVVEAWDQS